MVQIKPVAMMGELERGLGADAMGIGVLSSAYFITYILLQAPMGWLLDRFGPRLVLSTSMVLGALGLLWFGRADTLASATVARIVLGIAGAPAFAAAALVAARGFRASRFALMLGLTESFTLLGGIAVTLGLPLLADRLDRSGSGAVLAGLSLLLGVASALMVEGPGRRRDEGAAADRPTGATSITSTFLDLRLWLAAVHGGLFFGIISSFAGLWAAPFLRARLDLAPELASQPVAVLFAGGVLGAPLLGLLSGLPRWRMPTLLVASVACALAMAGLVHLPLGMGSLLALFAVLGFFSGVFAVDLACIRDVVDPARRGLAMGAANMILVVVGGPLLQLVVAGALDAGDAGAMDADLPAVRTAMNWFVIAAASTVPLALLVALTTGSGRGSAASMR